MARTRRIAAPVASLAALAIVLSACSSGGSTPSSPDVEGGADAGAAPISEDHRVGAMDPFVAGEDFVATEPVTFGLLYRDHPNYPVQEDWSIFTHLAEDHNVTFDRVDVPLADWDQKKALLIAAGDAPEIISVTYPGQETQFVAGGAVLPISDYFEYMPNFTEKVEEWGLTDELWTRRQADGKIYQLPGIREVPDVQYTVAINVGDFEKAGITEDPATWDQFAEDLLKVKEANPDLKYPMSDRWTDVTTLGAFLSVLAPNFDTNGGWGQSNTYFDADSDQFILAGTSDEYRDLVAYVAGLVASGALDPEITQSDDQAVQKFISGQSAAISANTQTITELRTKLADAGKEDVEVKLLTIPGGPAGDWVAGSQLSSGLMLSSKSKDSPYFLAMLQFLDWLYFSDEGLEFATWGVEGETFTRDADGNRVLMDDIGWNALNPDAPKKLNADFGYSNGVFLLANGSSKDLLQSVMSPEVKDWTNAVLESKEIKPVDPAIGLTELELEQTSLLDSQIKDAIQAGTAAFITGQRPMSDWDAYVAEVDALGTQQLLDTVNNAYQRTKAASATN